LRTIRKVINTGLPIAGVVVILSAMLFVRELRVQIAVVVFGILLIEAGIWNLAQRVLPDERKYLALRVEGDQFIALIRNLNAAALAQRANDTPENQQAFDDVREAMHEAVERMADVAGKTDAELAAESEAMA
jgi:uncharacterized membrane protein YfbV (UPF0208 family)